MHCKDIKNNKGFTLIELLVVIAIIGLLSSVIMASLNTARNKADVAAVQEEFEQIDTAIENIRLTKGEVMGLITTPNNPNAWCTVCGFDGVTKDSSPENAAARTANAAAWADLGYSSPPVDPWGQQYTFDENEFEANGPDYPSTGWDGSTPGVEDPGPLNMTNDDCRYDEIYSAGPDGIIGTSDDYYWNVPGLYCPPGEPTGALGEMQDPNGPVVNGISSWGATRLSPE